MPEDRNYKYISTWKGKHTKWDYKLEVILPPVGRLYGWPLDNPTEIPLPIGSISLKKSKVAYKDYVISLPETPTMTLDIDFDLLQESNYDTLRNAFFEESPVMTVLHKFGTLSQVVQDLSSGIIFNLYIKFIGCDNNDPIPYRLVRTCIHQANGKIKLNAKKKQITIDALDVNRIITSAFPWQTLEFYESASPVVTDKVFDFRWTEGGATKEVYNFVQPSGKVYPSDFKFMQNDELETIIKDTGTEVKRLLMRDDTQAFDLITYLPTMYKQKDDGTGDKGTELLRSDLYIMHRLEEDSSDDILDGLFFKDNKNSFYGRYPNGVWDYLTELGEFGLRQYRVGPSGITSGFSLFNNLTIDLNKVAVGDIDIKSEQYKTITSSCYEIKSDEATGGDIEKWEEAIAGGRNEANWTIPIVFNNTPPNVKSEKPSPGNTNEKRYFRPKITNLYYIDTNKVYRCHEWAKFTLAYDETGNKTSDDYNSFSSIPRTGLIDHPERIAIGCQVESGIPQILAKTLRALLESGLDKIDIELQLDEHVEFVEAGGGTGFIWNYQESVEETFSLNLAEIFGITYTKNKWKMLSSEIDYLTETAKVTLINLNI